MDLTFCNNQVDFNSIDQWIQNCVFFSNVLFSCDFDAHLINTMYVRTQHPDIDGGYAWAILSSVFLWEFIVASVHKGFGVIHIYIEELFQQGAFKTSLVAFVLNISMGIFSPLAGYMCDRWSRRTITMVSGMVVSGLYHLTSLSCRAILVPLKGLEK